MNTISPRHLTIKRWCDQMVAELEPFGPVPRLMKESDWQSWGEQVNLLPALSGYNPPDPAQFSDFYTWAERFNSVIQGIQ